MNLSERTQVFFDRLAPKTQAAIAAVEDGAEPAHAFHALSRAEVTEIRVTFLNRAQADECAATRAAVDGVLGPEDAPAGEPEAGGEDDRDDSSAGSDDSGSEPETSDDGGDDEPPEIT